jgi:hypothetical protein
MGAQGSERRGGERGMRRPRVGFMGQGRRRDSRANRVIEWAGWPHANLKALPHFCCGLRLGWP